MFELAVFFMEIADAGVCARPNLPEVSSRIYRSRYLRAFAVPERYGK